MDHTQEQVETLAVAEALIPPVPTIPSHENAIVSPPRAVDEKTPDYMISQAYPIPDDKLGWFIGKGGSYINQLSVKSGAFVVLSSSTSEEFGRVWRYLQIRGTGRSVDKAKKLLHIRLERFQKPRSTHQSVPCTRPNT